MRWLWILDGRRFGYEAQVPKLKDGEAEPYVIRACREDDLPFIEKLYEQMTRALHDRMRTYT